MNHFTNTYKSQIKRPSFRQGTTLVELMIAVSILGIVSIGLVGAFASIGKSIQFSKSRMLASNLATEQMQILKQKSFNKVLVTTATVYNTNFTPSVPYDNGYYPPENITEGGIQFTRYTYVQVADENSGSLQYFGAVPDTGMKAILVTVVWNQGTEKKKVQMRNILSNIDTTMTNSIFNGTVTRSPTTTGIPNAVVSIAENVGYTDNTNASGAYSINLSPGSYNMYVTADGYFPIFRYASIAANQTQTQNFAMVAMGSGTIRGTAWLNDHLVISQVVAATESASGFCQEYVELFNPSTSTWSMYASGSPLIDLKIQKFSDPSPTTVLLTYNVFSIPPRGYYLIANTTTITAVGVSKAADAVFTAANAGYPNLIPSAGGGPCPGGGADADSIGIAWSSSGQWIDRVGWDIAGHTPNFYETDAIDQTTGLEFQEQYVRRTSTSGVTTGHGRAYDSGNNNLDFVTALPMIYPPRNSLDTETVVSGTPAIGAFVSATDGLSGTINATSFGSPPVAQFLLPGVATGTWTTIVSSGSYLLEVTSVTVTQNTTTYITNSVTSPAWPASNYNVVIMTQAASGGYISGWVKNILGVAISPGISVASTGGYSTTANTTLGTYLLSVASGTYDVTANANNQNSSYISVTSQTVVVPFGQVVSDVNFTISQGGRIRGFVTRDGINAIPGVAVTAFDTNGVARDEEISGSDGRFTMVNLATGTYTVEPILGSGETSTPSVVTTTVTAGGLAWSSTFTITGSFGYIRGNATYSGTPIRTGVLVVCSTTSLASGPPTLSATTLTGAGYYISNTYEDGSYVLEVRGSTSTTYNLAAYYTTFSGTIPIISTRTNSSISVTAGNTTSGINFAW